ncbi:MAG: MFS transporter [Candidatus Odinarchaeota archaeon]
MKRDALHGISRQYVREQVGKTTIHVIKTPVSVLFKQKLNAILVVIVIMETAFSASNLLIPFVISKLGAGEIGIIIVSYYLFVLSASYFGYLSDRYGRKKLLVPGTFMAAISFVIFPYSENFWVLVAVNSLKGLSSAAISTSVLAMFADLAPPGKNGEFMGKFYLARSAGGGIGFIIGGIFWDLLGRNAFLFFSMILFIVCSMFLAMDEPRVPSLRLQRFTDFWNVEHSTDELELNPLVTLVDSFKDREFRKFSVAWLCFASIVGIALTYSAKIIENISEETGLIKGGEGTFLGVVFLAVAVLVGVSQPFFGRASDTHGRKAFLLLGTTATALLAVILTPVLTDLANLQILLGNPLSLSTAIVLKLDFGFNIAIPTIWITMVMAFLLLCASSFTASSLGTLTDVTKESERGKSMGIIQTLLSTGSMVGILFGGFAFDNYGILGILGLCFFLAMITTAIVISQIEMRNLYLVAAR